jgi:hypothetical protein
VTPSGLMPNAAATILGSIVLTRSADLAAVLRRILAGERGAALLRGLDEINMAIIRETLARLGE